MYEYITNLGYITIVDNILGMYFLHLCLVTTYITSCVKNISSVSGDRPDVESQRLAMQPASNLYDHIQLFDTQCARVCCKIPYFLWPLRKQLFTTNQ